VATALLCSNKEGCSHGTVVDSLISHNSRLSRDFCDGVYRHIFIAVLVPSLSLIKRSMLVHVAELQLVRFYCDQ